MEFSNQRNLYGCCGWKYLHLISNNSTDLITACRKVVIFWRLCIFCAFIMIPLEVRMCAGRMLSWERNGKLSNANDMRVWYNEQFGRPSISQWYSREEIKNIREGIRLCSYLDGRIFVWSVGSDLMCYSYFAGTNGWLDENL